MRGGAGELRRKLRERSMGRKVTKIILVSCISITFFIFLIS